MPETAAEDMPLNIKSSVLLKSGTSSESSVFFAPGAGQVDTNNASELCLGHTMPRLGFGVWRNYDTTPSVLEAFKAGYR